MATRLARWADQQGVPVQVAPADARTTPELGAAASKEVLHLVRHRGAVLKPCTGRTDSLLCCNLNVLTQVVGCPLDCSYCVLQAYQNSAVITVGANGADILSRLEAEAAQQPRRLLRVCTGQVGDSLALEPELGFASRLVRQVARSDNLVLELKTKTDAVDDLLPLDHGGRTIVSWSLSPAGTARREEHGCASLDGRLQAAARAARAGYLVGFHLDPMIPGVSAEQEQQDHRELLTQALDAVPPDRLAHVSLGTVRFPPSARRTMLERFPDSRATLGELLPEADGKLRLLSPRRVALYRAVAAVARARCPELFIYLCMEPARIWRAALGSLDLDSNQAVELAFARSLHRRFGLCPEAPDPAHYPAE